MKQRQNLLSREDSIESVMRGKSRVVVLSGAGISANAGSKLYHFSLSLRTD